MQLIALAGQNRVQAHVAAKRLLYVCPECYSPLRVRSGPHRQPHFYHLSKNSLCNQSGKSLHHLNTQLAIIKQLPFGEAEIEVSFPALGRIADVVWWPKKILFEVQCSPISLEEITKRTFDYESIGWTVVWILHEKRYNRRFLSAAEAFLIERDVYYTSYDEQGAGKIYDQFSLIQGDRRLFQGVKLPISLVSPYFPKDLALNAEWPSTVRKTFFSKRLGFQGDLIDRICQSSGGDWQPMKQLEANYLKSLVRARPIKDALLWLKNVYLSLLHALLEIHSV